MKPDTVSLRETVVRKRFNEGRNGDPERFRTLWELVGKLPWYERPFMHSLFRVARDKFPKAKDVVLQNKSWR